jgi:hypothetical protein
MQVSREEVTKRHRPVSRKLAGSPIGVSIRVLEL